MNWKNITLFQFQEADRINANPNLDEVDKVLYTTCVIFNLTEHQLDTMHPAKASILMQKTSNLFAKEFHEIAFKRIGKYRIQYDVSKMNLGQYIELSYFLQGNPIKSAHYILASISNPFFKRYTSQNHKKRAEYFQTMPVTKVVGSVKKLIESFAEFNKEYPSLFGLPKDQQEQQSDPFNKTYGWQFSAREVANDMNITLDEAYNLQVREAMYCLAYLKAKGEYMDRISKLSQTKTNAR